MGDWNGIVPTILAGYVPSGDDWSAILGELTALSAAWTDYSPTLTNLTLGGGTQYAKYRRVGKTVDYYWQFVYGSSSAVGTAPSFTLPVAPATYYGTGRTTAFPGTVHLLNSGVEHRQGNLAISSGSTVVVSFWNATPNLADITATAPWTWNAPDAMTAWGSYEAA
jgi:hypothetical protein